MNSLLTYLGKATTGDDLYLVSDCGRWDDGTEPVVSIGMRVSSDSNIWRVLRINPDTANVTVAREPDLNDTYIWHVSSLLNGYPLTHSRFLKTGPKLRGIEVDENERVN